MTGDVATRMRVQKEQGFHLNGMNGNRVNNALSVYYNEVIEEPGEEPEGKHLVGADAAETDAGDSAWCWRAGP